MTAVRVVLAVAALALVGGVVLNASGEHRRLVGTNRVVANGYPLRLNARHPAACQDAVIAAGAGALRFGAAGDAGTRPPLDVRLDGHVAGRLAASRGVIATIPIPVAEHARAARVCLELPAGGSVGVAGSPTPPGHGASGRDGRATLAGVMGIQYLTPGRESWWSRLGVLKRSFGWGKATWQGSWTLVLCALLALAALGLAAVTLVRSVRES